MSYWNDRNFGMLSFSGNSYRTLAGLKTDGTVEVTGYMSSADLSDLIQISSGDRFVLGITAANNVVVAGDPPATIAWSNVVQTSAGVYIAAGVDAAGNGLIAQTYNDAPDVANWINLAQVAVGSLFVVGVKNDGTMYVSDNKAAALAAALNWTGIIQADADDSHVVGLKADGTAVATGGSNSNGETSLESWTGLVKVVAGYNFSAGLKSDGSVVYKGYPGGASECAGWTNVVDITASAYGIVGLLSDGSVVGAGSANISGIETWRISLGQLYDINGITSIDGGIPVSMEVRAHEANAGGLLFKTQSDAAGNYTLRLPRWYEAYVMVIPPAGHQPMCHGPITKPDDIQV